MVGFGVVYTHGPPITYYYSSLTFHQLGSDLFPSSVKFKCSRVKAGLGLNSSSTIAQQLSLARHLRLRVTAHEIDSHIFKFSSA